MIRRKDEMEPVTRHELQKGMGDVTFHTFMTKEEAYGSGRTFARVVFEPGTSIGIHEHHGEFEGYYVLKGQALVTDNGVETVLEIPLDEKEHQALLSSAQQLKEVIATLDLP